jgi:tetratricopeptide (TPR) repeat protein
MTAVALGLVLSLSAPTHAGADAPSAEAVAEARRNEAKTKFDEGVTAFREHRYADAVQAFQRADAIAPSAALSFNIGRSFERLGNASSALRWYRDYLRRSPQAANAKEVQSRVRELADSLAERGVQQISVLSTPDGAAVLIDDQPVGVTPITIELAPGPHRAQLRLSGYRDQQLSFTLEPRTPQDVALTLELAVPAATPATTPRTGQSRRDEPNRSQRPFGFAPWLVLGAGGAGMLAALGFEVARQSAESEAERASQFEYTERFDAMQSRQTTARVLAGVGGALLITGGVLLVLNKPREPLPQLALGCTDAGCSLSALGSFR